MKRLKTKAKARHNEGQATPNAAKHRSEARAEQPEREASVLLHGGLQLQTDEVDRDLTVMVEEAKLQRRRCISANNESKISNERRQNQEGAREKTKKRRQADGGKPSRNPLPQDITRRKPTLRDSKTELLYSSLGPRLLLNQNGYGVLLIVLLWCCCVACYRCVVVLLWLWLWLLIILKEYFC